MIGVTAITMAVLMAGIVIPPGGLWGPVPGAGTTGPAAPADLPRVSGPRSTSDMATVNPGATLTADEFDGVVAASAADALKATGAAHVHAAAPAAVSAPGNQHIAPEAAPIHQHTASEAAAVHQHTEPEPEVIPRASAKKPAVKNAVAKKPVATKKSGAAAAKPALSEVEVAAVVYTCPMHPEVRSSKPGTCPKCGMALVKTGSKK